ncbi:hypothetical protein [Nibricoccus sp. IMCC34717]|uniref:hypothetical protein n=1 Tax=Nibricoccus sp. IMCC34717 TaxID=3034021 RepID=UPI00384D4A80
MKSTLFVAALAFTTVANATSYTFHNITNTGNTQIASQLAVQVTDYVGYASFKFTNTGSVASNITEIYFDNGVVGPNSPLTGFKSTTNGSGVYFNSYAPTPGNVPGGNTVGFTSDYGMDTANGANKGINPGEWMTVELYTNASAIAALNSNDLRIGMHIRSIGTQGGSDSYVTDEQKQTRVPDAASTFALGFASIAGLVALRRKR